MLFVSAQIRTDRLHTCRACEHYVVSTRSCGPLVTEAFTDSPLCGCYMPAKTKLKVASCPLGKWEALIKPEDIEQIRIFLNKDDREKTAEELTAFARKYIGPSKAASSCSACNRKLLTSLKNLVHDADSQT